MTIQARTLQNLIHLTIQAQIAIYGIEPFARPNVLTSEISTAVETCRQPLRDHVKHTVEDAIFNQVTAEPDEDYQVTATAIYNNHMTVAMKSIYQDGYARGVAEMLLWIEGYGGSEEIQNLLQALRANFHEVAKNK
jgi:hypothetical protein